MILFCMPSLANTQKLLSLAIVAASIFNAAHAAPPGYSIVWKDEFNGTSVDAAKWKFTTGKRDSAQLTDDAVSVDMDGLRIRSFSENQTHYTGFLTTADRFATVYGYFESRIRFYGAPGQWCAFWLQSPILGKTIGDPRKSGVEVDVIEHRVNNQKNEDVSHLALFNLHWDGYGVDHKRAGSQWISPASLDGAWHTYAVLWTADEYVFYVDDVERWRTSTVVSHAPQEIRLTCEIKAKGWAGKIPDAGYGARQSSPYGMSVRWLRVWKKTG